MKNPHLYQYNAHVVSVYDGDTCTVDIDLGLNIWTRGEKIRLNHINAPELRKKNKGINIEGLPAKAYSGSIHNFGDH